MNRYSVTKPVAAFKWNVYDHLEQKVVVSFERRRDARRHAKWLNNSELL